MEHDGSFNLKSETIDALPIINHYLSRLKIDEILNSYLDYDNNYLIPPHVSMGVLLRNLIIGREPIYGLQKWASTFAPELLNLQPEQVQFLNDDRVGRALDKLFDVDRASLMTEVVTKAIKVFDLDLKQLHNDSTTVTFSGKYEFANGDHKRGKKTLKIAHGHNKDHRPDLKQLLWILTVTADGTVPIHYRTCDGNTTDDTTHIDTWNTLRELVGRPDFIYVADCKLCVTETLKYIDGKGGLFITVLPQTRSEGEWFKKHIIDHEVAWEEFYRQPREDEEEKWRMVESPIRSKEGFKIAWCWSEKKSEQDMNTRQDSIEKAISLFKKLQTRLLNKRCRIRTKGGLIQAAEDILKETKTKRWMRYEIKEKVEKKHSQTKRGRPGPNTLYVIKKIIRFEIECYPIDNNIRDDSCSDGMFPLITNCEDLPLRDVLEKYKYQPKLEKRYEQLKSVYDVMPVLLKSVTRIEGLLFVFFLTLLVQALIERQMRLGMKEAGLKSLPIYHEWRPCTAPTASKIFECFSGLQRNYLLKEGEEVQVFNPKYIELHSELLRLLKVPEEAYPGMN